MTKDEAISLLHDMKDTYDEIHENTNWDIGYEQMTALDMAIEALQKDAERQEMIIRASERHLGLVRCKDCKSSRVYGKTTQWLACEDVMEGQATDPDGYCYLGERREE